MRVGIYFVPFTLDHSIRHAGVVMHDRVEDRLVGAAGVFLDLGAADAYSFGVGEQLVGQFATEMISAPTGRARC